MYSTPAVPFLPAYTYMHMYQQDQVTSTYQLTKNLLVQVAFATPAAKGARELGLFSHVTELVPVKAIFRLFAKYHNSSQQPSY